MFKKQKPQGDPLREGWLTEISSPDLYVEKMSTVDKKNVKITGDAGARLFAQAFANNPYVQELTISGPDHSDLEESFIGVTGYTALGNTLKTNTTLKTLKITGQKIDFDCALALVNSLRNNRSLVSLNLWKNRLEDHTAFEIIVRVLDIPTLEKINLGENLLSEDGKKRIEDWVLATKPLIKVQMF